MYCQDQAINTTILHHKPCLKYRITVGPNILLLVGFNPCTKCLHLTIGIVLRYLQQINDVTTKSIHLETFVRIIVTNPNSRTIRLI